MNWFEFWRWFVQGNLIAFCLCVWAAFLWRLIHD